MLIMYLIASYTTEPFHVVSQCQLRCGVIWRPVIQSLKKKELNILSVNTMSSWKAKICSSFSVWKWNSHWSLLQAKLSHRFGWKGHPIAERLMESWTADVPECPLDEESVKCRAVPLHMFPRLVKLKIYPQMWRLSQCLAYRMLLSPYKWADL